MAGRVHYNEGLNVHHQTYSIRVQVPHKTRFSYHRRSIAELFYTVTHDQGFCPVNNTANIKMKLIPL